MTDAKLQNFKQAGNAVLDLGDQKIELPIVEGTEGERGVDVTKLRAQTKHITVDPGYSNTGACYSDITFIDGDKGILRYRGMPIEDLAINSTYIETAYLIMNGVLPSKEQLGVFRHDIISHSLLPEDMKRFFDGYQAGSHPMSVLASMVCSLSAFYPDCLYNDDEAIDLNIKRLIAKASTIAAFSYKKSVGQPFIWPQNSLGYVDNFLNMMFALPTEPYQVNPVAKRALEMILILHVDHEQNCSTSTVRMAGSSQANLYASMSAGISALWGYLHGGANQSVIEMLVKIKNEGSDVKDFIQKIKDKKSGIRLMGFGHRVYKNFDPRALILKKACDEVLGQLNLAGRPLLEIAKELEEAALSDDYFIERKLYPNVDFYSGIILKALGIPLDMFTVIFALGRMPGWIAQWKEMRDAPDFKIARPRQIYTGLTKQKFVPIDKR